MILRLSLLVTSLIPSSLTSADKSDDSKVKPDSKVVGGFDITLDQAPFLASLQKPGTGHFCGGSLISLLTVLTGCHCLGVLKPGTKKGEVPLRDWADMRVFVGSEDIDDPNEFSQSRDTRDVRIHPDCSFERYIIYDFGVIFVESPFQNSPKVHPFEVVSYEKRPFDMKTRNLINNNEMECFVAGWGATDNSYKRHSYIAKGARMKIISDSECGDMMSKQNTKFRDYHFGDNAQMCSLAFGVHANVSDCIGDSGGPFFCEKSVYGVVSYGYDCGYWDNPSVYSKVSYFVEWYAQVKYLELETTLRSSTHLTTPTIVRIKATSASSKLLQSIIFILFQLYVI